MRKLLQVLGALRALAGVRVARLFRDASPKVVIPSSFVPITRGLIAGWLAVMRRIDAAGVRIGRRHVVVMVPDFMGGRTGVDR